MNLRFRLSLVGAAALALCLQAHASTTVSVSANADLYNADAPGTYDGTNPVAINVTGLTSITFSNVTGSVTVNGSNYNDADGVGSVSGETDSGTSTLSGITTPTAGFIAGVFIGATESATAPAALSYTSTSTSFTSASPLLQQAFFIGDGLTGDATGSAQTFYIPTGATTLYLGLTDACGYAGAPSCFSDNSGTFSVTLNGVGGGTVSAVPEPANATLLLAGLGAVAGFGAMRRRRSPAARG